jgi:metallophosphoesterase (TIGR03767 family)
MARVRQIAGRVRPRRAVSTAALVGVAALVAGAAGSGLAQEPPAGATLGKSTLEQTIRGEPRRPGAFAALSPAAGEPHVVREGGIATARAGRERRRRSLAYFAQLTDFQLSDEESPARVEFVDSSADDPLNSPFGAAWRPQEALVAHMTDQSIRQVNAFAAASPVPQGDGTRAKLGFALTTGDSADSQQRNETEAVLRLLEGGRVITNSGSSNPADYARCPPGTTAGLAQEAPRYTGVQDYDDGPAGTAFYDPDEPAGQFAAFPRFPGLMDRAQTAFDTPGLAVPSYVTFGNHDALVQGNQAANAAFEEVGTSCLKVFAPAPGLNGAAALAAAPQLLRSLPPRAAVVPPDPARQFVSKRQYKELHRADAESDGHGFALVDAEEERASGGAAGYYAWAPAPGFRFIALDTVSEGGVAGPSANGNLDDPQFRWLGSELAEAEEADELVVLFGHHPIRSLSSPVADEAAPPCTAPDRHGHDVNPGCDLDPRSSQPIHQGADLEALLKAAPNVIALVSGHTHENRAAPVAREDGGGFWTIETAAEIDFPHQNRLLEVMDNRDGTLSIFGTVLDNAAPVPTPPSGTAAGALGVAELASIGRLIGYNDPQAASAIDKGEIGAGGLGRREDRNVELLLRDPRASAAQAPTAPRRRPARRRQREGSRDRDRPTDRADRGDGSGEATGAAAGGGGMDGSLPFTGLALGLLAAGGAGCLTLGVALRRRAG